MKRLSILIVAFCCLFCGCAASTTGASPQEPMLYSDNFATIRYLGIVENEEQIITSTGMGSALMQGVFVSIENHTDFSFVVTCSELYVDGIDYTASAAHLYSYTAYGGHTRDCVYYVPNLNNLSPTTISGAFLIDCFSKEGIEPYYIDFSLNTKGS